MSDWFYQPVTFSHRIGIDVTNLMHFALGSQPTPRRHLLGHASQLFLVEEIFKSHLLSIWYGVLEIARGRVVTISSNGLWILAIPAMSLKCKRVFFCCSKQTALESSNVSGETLWRQECLKNWQNRGAIEIAGAFKAVLLDVWWGKYCQLKSVLINLIT